jgi:hypothetical protein
MSELPLTNVAGKAAERTIRMVSSQYHHVNIEIAVLRWQYPAALAS